MTEALNIDRINASIFAASCTTQQLQNLEQLQISEFFRVIRPETLSLPAIRAGSGEAYGMIGFDGDIRQ